MSSDQAFRNENRIKVFLIGGPGEIRISKYQNLQLSECLAIRIWGIGICFEFRVLSTLSPRRDLNEHPYHHPHEHPSEEQPDGGEREPFFRSLRIDCHFRVGL